MFELGEAWSDEATLTTTWRAARPFAHIIVDDFIDEARLPELLAILEEEAVERNEADLYAFDATAREPQTAEFRALRDEFSAALAPRLSRITGRDVHRADMRAYAYRPGHYLLPHTDHQEGLERVLAYAYYLPSPESPEGGELELFTCEVADGELGTTTSAKVIGPRANRIVIFEVTDVSLHQVREVLAGLRISLAGWFYR